MILNKLYDKTMPGLEKALDLAWRRNEALSSNIANAETPQYRAVDLNFASELQRAFQTESGTLVKTDAKHMDIGQSSEAHLIPDLQGVTKADGNNVDLDLQMGKLAYNSSKYAQAANLVRKKFTLLSQAIRQGV